MFLLAFVVAGMAIGFAAGGNLSNLAGIPFRFSWLVPLGFAVQVVVLSPLFAGSSLSPYVPWGYVFSILIVLLAVLLNLHLKAIQVLGLGLVMNLTVIAANGGFMPVALDQLAIAGHVRQAEKIRSNGHLMNAQALTTETHLPFLADIFAIPSPVPLSNVFSVGDVFIGIGALVLVCGGMRGKKAGAEG